MGLSSSQARMLLLTARKSDLEYRAQMISQRKINLAMQTQDLATKYSQSLNNTVMQLQYATVNEQPLYEKLSYQGLTAVNANNIGNYVIRTASGKYAALNKEDKVRIATEMLGAKHSTPIQTTVYKFKALEEGSVATTLSYSALTTGNNAKRSDSAQADYIVKDKDGAIVAPDLKSAVTMAAKFKNATLDNSVLSSETEMINQLQKYGVQYKIDADLSSNEKFQSGLQSGDYVLWQATFPNDSNEKEKTYKQVESLDNTNHLVKTTESKVTFSNMSGLSDDELIAMFEQEIGEFAEVQNMAYSDYFQDALKNGGLFIQKAEVINVTDADGNSQEVGIGYKTIPWSSVGEISNVRNTADDAQAEADYESKSLTLSNQDKMLDLELNQIQTQHKAIETEYDSVKKVIEKNIDISYKIFA